MIQRTPETKVVPKERLAVEHPLRLARAVFVEPRFTDRDSHLWTCLRDLVNPSYQFRYHIFAIQFQRIEMNVHVIQVLLLGQLEREVVRLPDSGSGTEQSIWANVRAFAVDYRP